MVQQHSSSSGSGITNTSNTIKNTKSTNNPLNLRNGRQSTKSLQKLSFETPPQRIYEKCMCPPALRKLGTESIFSNDA